MTKPEEPGTTSVLADTLAVRLERAHATERRLRERIGHLEYHLAALGAGLAEARRELRQLKAGREGLGVPGA